MRIAVFGAGGVGGYFGGRLALAGNNVVFIARGKHLEAMKSQGLRVDSVKGDFHISPVNATDDPSEVGTVDAVLVAVKAWQVPEAALSMKPMVGSETVVLPLENGVEAPAQLAEVLGKEHVLGGMCQIISFIAEPGHIRHTGVEPYIALGELDNRKSERVMRLHRVLTEAGISAEVPDDIMARMWEKFVFIASVSGIGAVTRASIGEFREYPGTREMLVRAIEEMVRVARAMGVRLREDIVERTMSFVDFLPYASTASMQRDIMEGRPSELESQNGAVVRMGKKVGVETPVHSFIYNSLILSEMKARGQLK
jgi:2-dehydropantoate 2-reductase